VAALFATSAHERGLLLRLHVDREVPESAVGDALRVRQVLNNLVSNAQKFTEKGEIAIRISRVACQRRAHMRLRAEVRDTGIGVPRGPARGSSSPSPRPTTPWRGASAEPGWACPLPSNWSS
jgi:signal transduction histidine kinase